MKNPLYRRLPRELKSEFGKYLVIFLLMAATIGIVSGFLVADGSMIVAYQGSFEKYNVENGNFRAASQMNKAQIKAVESQGVTLYENYYIEKALTNESTLRIFKNRQEVNLVCLMEGAFPSAEGEIAIDRMYAVNNKLSVGDVISSGDRTWVITGLVALPDYSCLFSDNNDSMFDSLKFGVAIVTPEEFDGYSKDWMNWSYSWKYEKEPADEAEENEVAEDLMKVMNQEVNLETYIPRYANQAIQFTGDDMGSDKAMMIIFLYIVIVIMAFVFGVTISNTITKEANVIGTLRASGYTKGELIRHYMAMPALVTVIGAIVGNILGYTVIKDVCVGLYYASYSLTSYVTIWSGEAFLLTTVVPLFLMLIINFFVLRRKLSLPPLKFLRRDISQKRQKRAIKLNYRIPFFGRFRLRVIFQNISNYVVLLVGILFANLLLMFGLLLPSILSDYQEEISENLLSDYQYMLQIPYNALNENRKLESMLALMKFQYAVETENEDAEKFSAYSLVYQTDSQEEDITMYGIETDSRYIDLDVSEGQVYISSAFADKFGIKEGDTICLKENYEDDTYTFQVDGIYHYNAALTLFMGREELNRTFDLGDSYFGGYFSDSEITDIDDTYIGSVIDLEALTKISRQLQISMGGMMNIVNGFAVVMFMILVYLLSKIIIEKNAQSISMAKILGYTNGEISRLYILSTSIVVVVFLLISLPIEYEAMKFLFRIMMLTLTGWITFYVDPIIYVEMFVMGLVTYGVVALLEYRKVRRVPMDEVLKNVE